MFLESLSVSIADNTDKACITPETDFMPLSVPISLLNPSDRPSKNVVKFYAIEGSSSFMFLDRLAVFNVLIIAND
jgi:hypothetical protein